MQEFSRCLMKKISNAFTNFNNSIAIAESLLKREKLYRDPPPQKSIKIVQGLRGGALVLMVASFENYLKEVMEERLTELSESPSFQFNSLPIEIIHFNFKKTLDLSINPIKKIDSNQKINQKISNYEKGSQFVVNRKINPEAFSIATRSNPNSERLIEMFKSLGHKQFFFKIKPKFEKKMGAVASTYIQNNLDFIVNRRHEVAHSGNALNLSRHDLGEYIIFIKTLSEICDSELFDIIKSLNK